MTATLPAPTPVSSDSDGRLLTIQANLLPDEVIEARLGSRARKIVFYCIAGAVVVMLAWTGVAKLQTSSAKSDLKNAQNQSVTLTNEQHKYSALVTAVGQTAAIKSQLQKLMTNDLNWSRLYSTMQKAAPAGVKITNFQGQITASASSTQAGAGTSLFNQTNSPIVGSVTIAGTAGSKDAVATYLDALAKQLGIAVPYPANVADASGSAVTFQATCLITSKALGGRFTTIGSK